MFLKRLNITKNTWLLLVVAFLATAWINGAQSTGARIEGRVTDGQGGVLPGASVSLVQNTKVVATAVTDAGGRYTLASVARGAYELRVQMPGFQVATRPIAVGDAATLIRVPDVALSVGGQTETVTVTADAPKVQASSARGRSPIQGFRPKADLAAGAMRPGGVALPRAKGLSCRQAQHRS